MKALLLHGTDGNHESNWFPWLDRQLTEIGWKVWAPDLPSAHEPNIARYNGYLLNNLPWQLDQETVLIGHSSGALASLGLLQAADPGRKIRLCVLVAAFKDDLGWPNLSGLFESEFDFGLLRERSSKYALFHSDNDPYCPIHHAEHLTEQLNGELIVIPGQSHFSVTTDPPCFEFPSLLELLIDPLYSGEL